MTPDAAPRPRELAGYRVLRSLARDDEAELLLGFAPAEAAGEEDLPSGPGEPSRSVALKATASTPESWRRTVTVVSALERARGDHVVQLLDADADDETLCLVFERLTRGDLAELLRLRPTVDAGEAVTLLAPLAATVQRMHAAGVAHGALSPRTVMFRDDGAPVLIGFGHATLFAAGSPEVVLERQDGVVADRRALRDLAQIVLSRVAGARAREATALSETLRACADDLIPSALRSGVFEMAAAVPVRFQPDEVPPASGREPTRLVPLSTPAPLEASPSVSRSSLLIRLIPDAWVQRVLDTIDGSPVAPVLAAGARRWSGWSSGRRRLVLGAGAAVTALLVALAVVPASPGSAAQAVASPSAFGSSAAGPAEVPTGPPTPATAAEGDDPVAAASDLVARRDRCLRSVSLLCLDGVDAPDSAALRADRAAVQAAQQGGEAPALLGSGATSSPPVLVERLGDSALVRLAADASATPDSGPASLLLVKGEAGWRIRDVIVAAQKAG